MQDISIRSKGNGADKFHRRYLGFAYTFKVNSFEANGQPAGAIFLSPFVKINVTFLGQIFPARGYAIIKKEMGKPYYFFPEWYRLCVF
jgi:hypothetical protein